MQRIHVVRIEAVGVRGTGFLVARDRVLTALHVVGTIKAGALVLRERVVLKAAVIDAAGRKMERVHVVSRDDVVAFDGTLDWACLAVDLEVFAGVPVFAISDGAELATHDLWSTYGFPDSAPDGDAMTGKISSVAASVRLGSEARQVLQLYSEEAGAGGGVRVRGYSGAPVEVRGAVVAFLSSAAVGEDGRSEKGALYGVPLATIAIRLDLELKRDFDDLLPPGTLSPNRVPAPSVLLNARHTVVPWHDAGRSEILADLDAWADDPSRAVAVRLLHAEGGIGKTRLAIEWVGRRRGRYDVAGFLKQNPDDRRLERLYVLSRPVLIVIDYAESRTDLVTVLQAVAALGTAPGSHRRVRVLLLARGDGDWWAGLPRRSSDISALLAGSVSIKVSPLATTTAERQAVFVEASRMFAIKVGGPVVLRPPISLEDKRFDHVLYLHMAALAAVMGVPFDAGSLMDAILDHEERFWVSQAEPRHLVAANVALARQLVAAATLRGGFTTQNEARNICARLEGRAYTREDDVLIWLLHDVYECVDETRYLPGLEPDLLGEGMVLRVAAPPKGSGVAGGDNWIERVLVAEDDPQALIVAFTVLGRASATDPKAMRPWITSLFRTDLPTRAVLALRAAKTVGQRTAFSAVGDLLAATLEQHGSVDIALELEREEIPTPTLSLTRVAVWQSRTLLEHCTARSRRATPTRSSPGSRRA